MIKKSIIIFVMLLSAAGTAFAKELPDFTVLADQEGAAVENISVTQAITQDQGGAMPYPAIPTSSRSANGWWRSARRSGWRTP